MIRRRLLNARFAGLAALVFAVLALTLKPALAASSLNWTQLSPVNSPPLRSYAAMAYDPVSKKVVLFGGYNGHYLSDTWTFDGTTWTDVSASTRPSTRTNAGMAYDHVTRKLVLFGGYNGAFSMQDTWVWDGSNSSWREVITTRSPEHVTGPMLFTDPVDGRVDVYGGFDGNLFQLTTFQWTGSTWRRLNTPSSATARSSAVCATDTSTKTTVLFGGLGDVNPNNTWTWNGSTWTQQNPSTQPPLRYGSPGSYDPRLKKVIVFGGGDGGAGFDDTWAWNGRLWIQVFPATSPSAREGYGMAYDAAIGHIVIFGGQSGNTFFDDTWQLDHQ